MSQSIDIRVNNFDLLRLIAASQVVLIHGVEHFGLLGPGMMGWFWFVHAFPGVPIFFAISGFLISLAYERSPDLRTYLRNRALRLFPALWLCLVVSIGIVVALGGINWHAVGPGRFGVWLAAQATVVQFYNPSWLRGFGVGVLNGSLWTIPVEMQFYLVLPVIYAVLQLERRPGNLALPVLLGIFWGINRWYVHLVPMYGETFWHKLLGVTFVPHLYLFLAGVLMQRNWTRVAPWIAGRGALWLAGYAVVAYLLHSAGFRVGTNTPDPLGVPFLLAAIFALAYTGPGLSDRLLRRNDISYGVYIYHMLAVNSFLVLGWPSSWSLIVLLFVVTFLAAGLSWGLVERRALARKRSTVHAVGRVPSPTVA